MVNSVFRQSTVRHVAQKSAGRGGCGRDGHARVPLGETDLSAVCRGRYV